METVKPSFSVKKFFFKILLGGALVSVGALSYLNCANTEVLIESQESKTKLDGPVFNKIRWFNFTNKEVWMMNQSHFGLVNDESKWDRLAIVIDKTRSPKVAKFMQLEPGPLEWKENLRTKPFRVSCFICHTNGPRAIRPNPGSLDVKLGFLKRVQIFAYNLRIKTYGKVLYDPNHDSEDLTGHVPFRLRGRIENDILRIKTCLKCHSDNGFIARGYLRRQNAMTIQFMVSKRIMPPLGFSLSHVEKRELQDFLGGF